MYCTIASLSFPNAARASPILVVALSSFAASAIFAAGAPSFPACSSIVAAFACTLAIESFASEV